MKWLAPDWLFVIGVQHGLGRAHANCVVDVHGELRKANEKIVNELVWQSAEAILDIDWQFVVVVLFVAYGAKQIAQAHSIVRAEFSQILHININKLNSLHTTVFALVRMKFFKCLYFLPY